MPCTSDGLDLREAGCAACTTCGSESGACLGPVALQALVVSYREGRLGRAIAWAALSGRPVGGDEPHLRPPWQVQRWRRVRSGLEFEVLEERFRPLVLRIDDRGAGSARSLQAGQQACQAFGQAPQGRWIGQRQGQAAFAGHGVEGHARRSVSLRVCTVV